MNPTTIDQFESAVSAVRAAIIGLNREDLIARPGPGDWSIQEVIIHLVDSDAIAIDRMKRMLTEQEPPLLYADETAYVRLLHPHEQDLEDALTLLEVGRRQWARVLRLLSPADLERTGMHNLRGRVTIRQFIGDYTQHIHDHLQFVYKKRERLGKPC
ncbi:MAG: DinB family protein [Bacteroidales bacterium]|nr:DinB family protein [Bacteroidales bacterium]